MKVFNAILGIFSMFSAFYCIYYPGITFLTTSSILIILMGTWGICAIFDYITSRKDKNDTHQSKKNVSIGGIGLAAAIIAVICSIVAMFMPTFKLLIDIIIIGIFIFWIIISGISSIFEAIKFKKNNSGKLWILSLVLGIITVISGFVGLYNIILIGKLIGLTIGMILMVYGIRLVLSVFEKTK